MDYAALFAAGVDGLAIGGYPNRHYLGSFESLGYSDLSVECNPT